jgi:hypothetical protein
MSDDDEDETEEVCFTKMLLELRDCCPGWVDRITVTRGTVSWGLRDEGGYKCWMALNSMFVAFVGVCLGPVRLSGSRRVLRRSLVSRALRPLRNGGSVSRLTSGRFYSLCLVL